MFVLLVLMCCGVSGLAPSIINVHSCEGDAELHQLACDYKGDMEYTPDRRLIGVQTLILSGFIAGDIDLPQRLLPDLKVVRVSGDSKMCERVRADPAVDVTVNGKKCSSRGGSSIHPATSETSPSPPSSPPSSPSPQSSPAETSKPITTQTNDESSHTRLIVIVVLVVALCIILLTIACLKVYRRCRRNRGARTHSLEEIHFQLPVSKSD